MSLIKDFKDRHQSLFEYLSADVVHPHDHFLDRTLLRFLPVWVTPNRVTMVRVILTPVVFLITLFGYYALGIVCFLLVAFTDAVDGSLARVRSKITRFGMLFDPLADKFLIGSMVLLLVFEYFPIYLGLSILGLEIIIVTFALVGQYKFQTVRMANIWGKIKMILQVCAVFLTLAALLLNAPYLLSVATGIFGLAIGFAIVSLFAHGV